MPSQEKNPAGISPPLRKQIPPNNNPERSFSIREYVLACRQKDVFSNWPFPNKYLQICLKHGISDVLPPLESRSLSIQSLRGYVGLNYTQQDDENANYFANKEPDDTIEQEIEDDISEQDIEDDIGEQEIGTHIMEIEDHTTGQKTEDVTDEQEIESHTMEQEVEDHMQQTADDTIAQETESHTMEQEIEVHTLTQEIKSHTMEQEIEDHTIVKEIEDECKTYSGSEEAVSELSIQHSHVSPNRSPKHEEIKTDSSPHITPRSHLNAVQCNKASSYSRNLRNMKKRHKGKHKKRSMVNILDVAKPSTSEDLLRVKRLCCIPSVPHEQDDEATEHLIDVKYNSNSDLTKDYSSEKIERDDSEAAKLSMQSRKRLVVKFKFSASKSNV